MLQVSYLRDNTERVLKGLQKKHFAQAAEAVQQAIDLDNQRKRTQQELDQANGRANRKRAPRPPGPRPRSSRPA